MDRPLGEGARTKQGGTVIFSKETGQRFETLTQAYIALLQHTLFHEATAEQMSVENLWARTWQAAQQGLEN
jgi:hypothetical protein